MTAVELVLFFGPPFIGKTLYYYQHYSQTHSRVSACEIFRKEENSNLRFVILKAIGLLCKGKSVVIDDENWYSETRKSYSSLVKKKVPNCTLTIIQFIPDTSFGYQQCLWAREWVLVYWTLLESGHEGGSLVLSDSDKRLDCWFLRRRIIDSNLNPPEFPTVSEEFSLITVKPELTCNTPYKFSLPALFIQWESIIVHNDGSSLTYKPGTPDVLDKWFGKNPSGRVIIIGPKLRHDKKILDDIAKLILLQLASQVSSPIYFTFIDVKHQPDQFSNLPHPGVIAFLQRMHTIHLHHKSTMYVYQSEGHYKAATSVGIRTVKAEKLFTHSHLIDSIYCDKGTQTLPFLKDIQQLSCHWDDSDNDNTKDVLGEASIAFLSRARESSSPLVWKYCHGKVNGVCFKDKLVLERYQTQYALAAQPALPPGKASSNLDTSENMTITSAPPADDNIALFNCPINLSIPGSACLEHVDIREVAETPGRYQGGFICKEKIFNLNVEVLECRLKISCKCMGSTGQPYDVEAIISNSSGLVEAHCSCPDPAGKSGRCKHVIGLLLNYKDRHASVSHGKENESFSSQQSETSRSLPSWMSSSNSKSREHIRKSSSSSKVPQKSSDKKSTLKRGVHTLYCMSQEELLETAREVLEKHKEAVSHGCDQPSLQEPKQSYSKDLSLPEEEKSEKERTVVRRDNRADVLEDLIFSAYEDKRYKKICTESISSFAEETPPDKQLDFEKDKCCVISAIIPDSLVPETVSLIPETVQSGNESSPRDEFVSRDEAKLEKNQETFQDFLDEII